MDEVNLTMGSHPTNSHANQWWLPLLFFFFLINYTALLQQGDLEGLPLSSLHLSNAFFNHLHTIILLTMKSFRERFR